MITDKLIEFLINIWATSTELAPWLLLGLTVAGILHIWIPNNFVKRHLGHGSISAVFKAVTFGVPMPLCSCGVIPAALGIKKQGAGDGAALGFLISTPQTGVDSIMVSASMLGLPFALFKLVSAFVLGIVGGLLAYCSDSPSENSVAANTSPERPPKTLHELLSFAVNDLLKMIWRWLFAGIIISAAITTWLPKDFFQNYLSDNIFIAMLVVLLISLPMYVCATASVPIAAALVANGMPAGAALVFLMAGPASNIATIGAVYRAFGGKKLFIYLASITIGSLISGWLFNSVITPKTVQTTMQHHEPTVISIIATILLFLLMLRFAIIEFKAWLSPKRTVTDNVMLENRTFRVGGITCQGCAGKLTTAINALDGIVETEVEIETGLVTVRGSALDDDILLAEIKQCGFQPLTE